MVFTTEAVSEVAIESWPEWDLNPRPTLKFLILPLYFQHCFCILSINVGEIKLT